MKIKNEQYPRIKQLGLTIITTEPRALPGISGKELVEKLGNRADEFNELFGCQTCGMNGLYPWDVESVLEQMFSGKKIPWYLWD